MKEWFEDWFNTEEYLNVYRHRNEAEAKQLVDLLLKFISIPQEGNVLDLACGAGRHALLFAQKGYQVTAVDLSDKLLQVAKKTAEENKINIDFIKSDIRYFSTDKKFDLILNLFTSFGYFENDEENFKLFDIAYSQLEKDGYFVLDYFNSNFVKENLVEESVDELNNLKLIQKRHIENKRVIKDIIIRKNGSEQSFCESVRMYNKNELVSAIENAGLKIKHILGGFEGEDFDEEKSQRIIIISKK
ncbi:MAG: class I SAM-dependent methyltransferase [Ignavibacteriaceae bacterium]